MFLSLGLILIVGLIGGLLFEKIHLPKLVFYIILGVLIGPSVFNIVDDNLLKISSYLRQIALVIILTRSGLSLDLKNLKTIGRPAILMCFVPASFEIIGISIFGPLLLNINYVEAFLLGSVLGAVSPAVVIPRMIKLKNEKYSEDTHLPELVMAGASCDDIFVIALFYAFKGLVATNSISATSLLQIPISMIMGIILGLIVSVLITFLFKKIKLSLSFKVIIMLGSSFLMIGTENILKEYISISSLLGIILMGMLILKYLKDDARKIQKSYNSLWKGFELLLFVLVGCSVDINYAISGKGIIIIGLLIIGLIFRSLGVLICIIATKYSLKEKIFIIISYLPKATVQASIGGIALTEGLACGTIILTAAVISILLTAPVGSILMDCLYNKLLEKNLDTDIN